MATRCPGGAPDDTYTYDGGGQRWGESAAIIAGTLSALKARLVLSMAIGAGLDVAQMDDLFETWRLPPTRHLGHG
jgi:L-asparaginase